MDSTEKRKHPRRKTKIAVNVHETGEDIPAIMIDISRRGIGFISERGISPGTEVYITINHLDDYAINGTIEWSLLTRREGKFQYRIGLKSDRVLDPEDIWKNVHQ